MSDKEKVTHQTPKTERSETNEVRTFVCEQTGESYRCEEYDRMKHSMAIRNEGDLLLVARKIIEPKLEIGDWIRYTEEGCASIIHNYPQDYELKAISEIRKANGEVWKKENGEWRKV